MSNANIDELNGQAVLDLIMGGKILQWSTGRGPSERIDNQMA